MWGGQAFGGQREAQGLSTQKTWHLLHSHLYSTSAPVALGSLQGSSDWDEPTVIHPDPEQSLALLRAPEAVCKSPPIPEVPVLQMLWKTTAAAARGVLPEQAQG